MEIIFICYECERTETERMEIRKNDKKPPCTVYFNTCDEHTRKYIDKTVSKVLTAFQDD